MRLLLCSLLACVFSFQLISQETSPDQLFSNYKIISVESESAFQSFNLNRDGIHRFNVDGWDMTLVDSKILADDYVSMNHEGSILRQGRPDILPMNGYTDEGYRVSLTIGPDFAYGFIKLENDFIYFEPARRYLKNANSSDVISYRSSDVKELEAGTCGFTDFEHTQEKIINQRNHLVAGLCYDVQYAICNDWSQVSDRGGTAQAEAFAIGVTNDVNTNYDDEFADELRHVITGQYNSTCNGCDPWTSSTNANTLLSSFRTWALSNLSFTHDVASLWTNRNLDGSTIGIAYVGEVCTSARYNVLEHFGSGNTETFRVLTAHELGHNWGSGHDASGGNIMAPSVSTATTWSAGSVAAIEAYYSSIGCLSVCAGSTPQVNFSTLTSTVIESGQTGIEQPCDVPYTDVTLTVELSVSPTANIGVSISIDGSGTATENEDFYFSDNSITFTPGGNLSQNITIRIYDDKIEETDETVLLNLSITSGTADLGPFDSHTLTISGSSDDQVSANCCSGGGEILYDDPDALHYANPTIFRGGSQDAKTRTIIPASELLALGLQAGEINKLSLYVYYKYSTGSYQNFRVGMYQTGFSTLSPSVPWYNTTQVFYGNVTTAVGWVEFDFDTPFIWNGTSNLYIDFCFNNTTSSSNDYILAFNPGTSSVEGISFRTASGTNGCNLNSGIYTLYYDRHPYMLFSQPAGAVVEEAVSSSSGIITVGNTAHFYSPDDEVILSIKNIGSTDMECVDVDIVTSGSGKSNLPFGSNQYSNKTFQIIAENNAVYEVTFYYSDTEMTTWGGNTDLLNVIQSSAPIASSNAGNSNFILTSETSDNIGSGSGNGFKAIVEGSGYFALTDGYDVFNQISMDDSDYCIEEIDRGIIFTNEIGDFYLISVDPSGNLETTPLANPMVNVEAQGSQIYMQSATRGMIFRRGSNSFTKLNVDNDGKIVTTNSSTPSTSSADLMTGDAYILEDGAGLVFRNSQSECWKVFVDNGGNLSSAQIPCN